MKYLCLQLKRAISTFPKIFISSMIIFFAIGIIAYTKISHSENSNNKKIKVGIVGNDPDGYLNIGISAVSKIDNLRYSIKFIMLDDEEAAKTMLKFGKLDVYAVFPNDFVKSLIDGRNNPMKIFVRKAESKLGVTVAKEVMAAASVLITETEAGIYTYHNFYTSLLGKIDSEEAEKEFDLNIRYLKKLLARETIFQIEETSAKKSSSIESYYFNAGLLLFMILWPLSTIFLFIRKDDSMQKLLKSKGTPPILILFSEWFSNFVLMLLCLAPIFVALFVFSDRIADFIPEFEKLAKLEVFYFILTLIPMMMLCSSAQVLTAELCKDLISAISIEFTVSIALAYISGFFYPAELLPETLVKIAKTLPLRSGFDCALDTLKKQFDFSYIAFEFVYIAGLFFAALVLKTRRIKNNG